MDSRTGNLYPTIDDARHAGVPNEHIVTITGPVLGVMQVSAAVKADRRRRAKAARKSRKANRRK